jgi:hypothetical protein
MEEEPLNAATQEDGWQPPLDTLTTLGHQKALVSTVVAPIVSISVWVLSLWGLEVPVHIVAETTGLLTGLCVWYVRAG